jgi:hypothetical protein
MKKKKKKKSDFEEFSHLRGINLQVMAMLQKDFSAQIFSRTNLDAHPVL